VGQFKLPASNEPKQSSLSALLGLSDPAEQAAAMHLAEKYLETRDALHKEREEHRQAQQHTRQLEGSVKELQNLRLRQAAREQFEGRGRTLQRNERPEIRPIRFAEAATELILLAR